MMDGFIRFSWLVPEQAFLLTKPPHNAFRQAARNAMALGAFAWKVKCERSDYMKLNVGNRPVISLPGGCSSRKSGPLYEP
jgi:hypothetical protein